MRWRNTLRATAVALAAATGIAGCAAPGGDDVVELTMWAWATDVTEVVDRFNATHPHIRVRVDTQAQGENLVTKLLTADWAGTGPDLAQAEYQALPSLVVSGVVADLTTEVAPIRELIPESTWAQVTFDDAVYAVPQDSAPMMMFYRQDLLDELGAAIPTTWDGFRELAVLVRERSPQRYLTTFSAADPGWFAGLAQQAGAAWWEVDERGWSVQVDDPATERVATFWGELLAADLIAGQPMYTPDWNSWLNDGTVLAWPGAVWSPGVLQGIAPATAGSWVMAPLPQWEPDDPATGSWGGSTTAVVADTDHPAEAAEFARWLNTDPDAVEGLITISNVYPAATTVAQQSAALDAAPSFLPNQPDFYELVAQIAPTAAPTTWGPVVNETYALYGDAFSEAVLGRRSFSDAVRVMQDGTLGRMRAQGYAITPR